MSPSKGPSAGDRLMRGSPAAQPPAGRLVSGKVRVQPVRFTIDLSPSDHDALTEWAHQQRFRKADVVRALLRLLDTDPDVAAKVRSHVDAAQQASTG